MKYTDKKNNVYTIKTCCKGDVNKHLLFVKQYTDSSDIPVQKDRMELSVINNLAYKIIKDKKLVGFFYFEKDKEDPRIIIAITYYHIHVKALTIFVHFITTFLKEYPILLIQPHKQSSVFYKISTEMSVRANYHYDEPLIVLNPSEELNKILELYNKYGFNYKDK